MENLMENIAKMDKLSQMSYINENTVEKTERIMEKTNKIIAEREAETEGMSEIERFRHNMRIFHEVEAEEQQ